MRTFVTDRQTDGADYIGPEVGPKMYKYREEPPMETQGTWDFANNRFARYFEVLGFGGMSEQLLGKTDFSS